MSSEHRPRQSDSGGGPHPRPRRGGSGLPDPDDRAMPVTTPARTHDREQKVVHCQCLAQPLSGSARSGLWANRASPEGSWTPISLTCGFASPRPSVADETAGQNEVVCVRGRSHQLRTYRSSAASRSSTRWTAVLTLQTGTPDRNRFAELTGYYPAAGRSARCGSFQPGRT